MAIAAAQVLDALAARLAPTTATAVVTDRATPIDDGTLPAWRLVAEDESAELVDVSASVYRHALRIEARGSVRAVEGLDDAMNALASLGLAALFAAPLPYQLQLNSLRREMVEDALGLKLYQHKKAESERKLEETATNIDKTRSLRREIGPHLIHVLQVFLGDIAQDQHAGAGGRQRGQQDGAQ